MCEALGVGEAIEPVLAGVDSDPRLPVQVLPGQLRMSPLLSTRSQNLLFVLFVLLGLAFVRLLVLGGHSGRRGSCGGDAIIPALQSNLTDKKRGH